MLPTSGSISLSQINTELGRSAGAQISLDLAENGNYAGIVQNSLIKPDGGNPARMSEWRGYNHSCPIYATISATTDSIDPGGLVTLTASVVKLVTGSSNTYTWSTGATGSQINVNPTSTTTYTVTVSTTGCSNVTASKTITVNQTTTCTPYGTLLSTECQEEALWGTYADGNCGSYYELIDPCHPECGCNPVQCLYYQLGNTGEEMIVVEYTNCAGTLRSIELPPGEPFEDCIRQDQIAVVEGNPGWLEAKPLYPCS